MRSHVLYGALGLVLVAGPSAAGAQTLIAPDYYAQPAGAVVVPQQPAATMSSVRPYRENTSLQSSTLAAARARSVQ